MAEKKYYWLKLKKDFFKRHDILIIESMPNGKDYILFYLKMLVESVDHDGNLRFSDMIPYNESMLATITNTNIDIVRNAMKVFTDLHMIDVLDDQTIHMAEVNKMLGAETYWADQKRKQRIGQCPTNVQLVQVLSKQEIESEIELNIDIEKEREPVTLAQITEYIKSIKSNIDPCVFYNYYKARGWRIEGKPITDWSALIKVWDKREKPSKTTQNFSQSTFASMSDEEAREIIKRKAAKRAENI